MSKEYNKLKQKKNKNKKSSESFTTPTTTASPNTKSKVSNTRSIITLNQAHQNDTTISGLNIQSSSTFIHIISALIGIFVFYFVPLLANSLNRPLTAVLLNVIPNDLLLGFFVVEAEFTPYLTNIIWTPLLNVLANSISYLLIFFLGWSANHALAVNIFIWLFAIFLSLYI
jgi:VIT1/CCC1 family predicted Fe2+/Mn2+ transporter